MKRLLFTPLFLLCFLSGKSEAKTLDDVVAAMRTPGVYTTIRWADCGEINAYYTIELQQVTLCNELQELDPAIIRYVLAHELAHGIIVQRDIPYTVSHEAAADELAAVMLLFYGDGEAIKAGAEFWFNLKGEHAYWDDHPANQERGYRLAKLWAGYNLKNEFTYRYWVRASKTWLRLLGYV